MQIKFFKNIKSSKRVLIAGVGGGFDIASGIPLYRHLRDLGKEVVLANFSFTDLVARSHPSSVGYAYEKYN